MWSEAAHAWKWLEFSSILSHQWATSHQNHHHLPETLNVNYKQGSFASTNRILTINTCLLRKKLISYANSFSNLPLHIFNIYSVLKNHIIYARGFQEVFLLQFLFWVVYFLFCSLNLFPVSHKMGKEQSSYTALNSNDVFPSLRSKSLLSRYYNGHKCMLWISSINSIPFLLKLLQQRYLTTNSSESRQPFYLWKYL